MITGPSSYDSTMAEFKKQWLSANTKLGASPLILTLPDKTSMTQAQFAGLHTTLLAQQDTPHKNPCPGRSHPSAR